MKKVDITKGCYINKLFSIPFAIALCCFVNSSVVGQESKKNSTEVQSFFGADSLVGTWEAQFQGMTLKGEYLLINKDGTVTYQEGGKIKWQGTYTIKGDNVITFDNLKYLDKEGEMRDFNYTEILNTDDMEEEEPTGCFIGGIFSIEPLDDYRYFCSSDELHLSVDLGDSVKEVHLVRTEVK